MTYRVHLRPIGGLGPIVRLVEAVSARDAEHLALARLRQTAYSRRPLVLVTERIEVVEREAGS